MTLHGAGMVEVVGGIVAMLGGVLEVGATVLEVGATATTVLGIPLTAAVEGVTVAAALGVVETGWSADAVEHPASITPTRPTTIHERARSMRANRTAAVSGSAVGADGRDDRAEDRDKIVGGNLDVETAFSATDEDGLEQHACLVDGRSQPLLLPEGADTTDHVTREPLRQIHRTHLGALTAEARCQLTQRKLPTDRHDGNDLLDTGVVGQVGHEGLEHALGLDAQRGSSNQPIVALARLVMELGDSERHARRLQHHECRCAALCHQHILARDYRAHMANDIEEARKELDKEFTQFRENLGKIYEKLERVSQAGPADDISELLKDLEDTVGKVRTGGLIGSGAKGHRAAREKWLELQGK